jgi:4-methylaminobutanoate oxidase (formaldehyde-forming)
MSWSGGPGRLIVTIDPGTTSGTVPSQAQVVIVGGGVTGCSIAYHLAHLGWTDVVLLEQHRLTAGTTWHAAGLITSAGMTDETALFFSRYSRDLYARLEAETGHSTGFRAVGHLSLATTPARQAALRREAAWMHGFGVEDTEISPSEVAAMWPLARTDDVLSAFYVADEGRADPVGVATSLAKGARQLGVRVVEGVAATGVRTRGRRVSAVVTEAGPIETEIVVNAAGMWARQFGALAGGRRAAAGGRALLPAHRHRARDGRRPAGDRGPGQLRLLPARGRRHAGRPVRAGGRALVAGRGGAGLLVRQIAARLGADGALPRPGHEPDTVPGRDRGAGVLLRPVAIDRTAAYETSRRFRAERTVEQLGVLFGDAVWPSWQPSTARNVRRSVLHDRLAAAGAHFGVSAGWEYPEWFADGGAPVPRLDYRRPASHAIVAREHAAVREAVGVIDMSLMAKLIVQGPDAAAVLSRLSANDVLLGPGRLVYTQWLNESGGIIADVTVTWLEEAKFLVIASDIIHRRIEPLIRRAARDGEVVTVTDVTSGTTLLTVQGPASRELIGRLTDADLSNDAFGYLTAQQIHVGYAPVLAIRVTYVGELGWELHVPAEHAAGVYDDLVAAGGDLGFRPVGLQAMSGLRLEKGYRDMGIDIDNTDNPIEAGLGFAVAWDKPGGFIGRDALLKAREQGPPRHRVVRLIVGDPAADLFGNEPVFADGVWAGYVRAAAYGYTVGGPVGLAQVACDDGVTGQWLKEGDFRVRTPDGEIGARLQIAPPYDPQRLRILDR